MTFRLGINANTQAWGGGAAAEQAKVKAATDVGWLREDFQWAVMEPKRGVLSFAHYDRLIVAAAEQGLRVLPILNTVPSWAGRSPVEIPADPGRFAYWAAKVIARYGPGGLFWTNVRPDLSDFAPTHFEVWNEPYIPNFSYGGVSPERYARLVKAVAVAGRKVNPRAKYLIQADVSCTDDWQTWKPWVEPMFAAVPDLATYFDGVAVHPYAAGAPSIYDPRSSRWAFRRLEEIAALFHAHGSEHPFWITEMGWTVWKEGPSETEQATFLELAYEMCRRRYPDLVEAMFVFGWRDYGPADPAVKESWWGMVRRDGSYRPAVAAMRRMAAAA